MNRWIAVAFFMRMLYNKIDIADPVRMVRGNLSMTEKENDYA